MPTIRLVRIERDAVRKEHPPWSGRIATAPPQTVCTGTRKIGRIKGTFTTYSERQLAPGTGQWQV